MEIRTTLQTFVDRTLAGTRRQTDALARLQTEIVTGKRLQNASDHPANMVSVTLNEANLGRIASSLETVKSVESRLNSSVSNLQQNAEIFTKARSIAIEASQSGVSREGRESLAVEVDQMIQRLLDSANAEVTGSSLYAGAAANAKAFAITARDSNGRPTQIQYQGAPEGDQVRVSQSLTIETLVPGSKVFQQRDVQPARFVPGSTGVLPGTAVNSATGDGKLLISHTATTYGFGPGVTPGTSSPAGDTVLGPSGRHYLVVVDTSGTGTNGTVSLNGGPAIPFSNADTDLRVNGPRGEIVYVNTTAITPGFNGAVSLSATGTMSTDGGATSTPITFANNQVVANSATGGVTHVDSSQIRSTGTEWIEHHGSYDAFEILMALRDDLRNTRKLPEGDLALALSRRIEEIDRVHSNLLGVIGEQSSTLQTLDSLTIHMEDMKLASQKLVSALSETDLADVVVRMQAQQNALQLTLQAYSRIFEQNFLDYLR